MDEVKNVEPKTNQKDLDTLWDIDEPTFEEAFDLSKDGDNDPVLKGLDLPEPETTKEDTEVENALDLDLDNPEGVEKSKRKKDWTEKTKKELDAEKEPENVRTGSEGMSKEIEEAVEKEEIEKIIDKDTEESTDTGENEFSVFAKMLSEKGIIDLNEEEFDPSEKGLVNAVDDTIDQRIKEEIDLFQKGLPTEGKDLLRHIMSGGTVSDFVNAYDTPNVEDLDIGGNNFQNQRAVLKEFLRLRGDNPEEINETLTDYEDLGKLGKQAEKAKVRLGQYYDDQRRSLAEKTRRDSQARETQRKEVLSQITDTITGSESIKGFPLSRKRKRELLQYMTEANIKVDGANGPQYVSQFQADEMKASQNVDDFILKAYLRMTDYDLEGVKKKSKTDFTSKLRSTLQNKKDMTDTQAKFGGNKKPGTSGNSAEWDI
jgi:hypothetical protein